MKKPKKELFIENTLKSDGYILDVGGGCPWKTGWIHEKYKKALIEKAFCVDYLPVNKPHVAANIMKLPFKDNCVGGIICNAVLEHVEDPFYAMKEMYRVLKKGGKLVFYVPWLFPYHPAPHDYFRYTKEGVLVLTSCFSEVDIYSSEFADFDANKIYTIICLIFPTKYEFVIKLIGRPLWKVFKTIFLLKCRYHGMNNTDAEEKLKKENIDNWGHGYWCYCVK
jgi:SAM-dependent methyltransferase